MTYTADVPGGKLIAVWSQSISGVNAVNYAFYDIHRRKREVLYFYFVSDTTRDSRDSLEIIFIIVSFYE
jgi:hypothetical protein